MASLNRIMMRWHAYKRVDGKRQHYGYYDSKEDAEEAEQLGKRTAKAWSANKRAEGKAETVVQKLRIGGAEISTINDRRNRVGPPVA